MKKLYLILFAMLGTLTASAGYNYMEFKTVDGATRTIAADGLEITLDGESIVATNTAAEVLRLQAASIASMEFTDYASSVAEISANIDCAVIAYAIDGTEVGAFGSTTEAFNKLNSGLYLLKSASGQTIKIIVSK